MSNAKRKTYKTNVEVLVDMMEFSRIGAIKQAFIMTAIEEYSGKVLSSTAKWDNGLINQEAWRVAAQECKDSLDEHLGRAKPKAEVMASAPESEGA